MKKEINIYRNICLVFVKEIGENKKRRSFAGITTLCVSQNNIFLHNELYLADRFAETSEIFTQFRSDEFVVWLASQQAFLKRKNKKNSREIDWAVI